MPAGWTLWALAPSAGAQAEAGAVLLSLALRGTLLIGVSPDGLDLVPADGSGARQDACEPTVSLPADSGGATPSADVVLTRDTHSLTLADLTLGTATGKDGALKTITLDARLDARELAAWLPGLPLPAEVCEMAVGFGGGCGPCPTDGESWCIALAVHGAPVEALEGVWVEVQRRQCHPGCDASWENAACETGAF